MNDKQRLQIELERLRAKVKEIDEKPEIKVKKFKELMTYMFLGVLISINIIVIAALIIFRGTYFSFNIDYARTFDFGYLIIKMGLLIFLLTIDLKTVSSARKVWNLTDFKQKEYKQTAKEGIKRAGIIRRLWFYWRSNEARKWVDKYNEVFQRLQRRVGKIKGDETKELKKLKKEVIKGILLWTDEFQITKVQRGKDGEKIITDIPVTQMFLEEQTMDDLYEDYLINCVESAERFVNGVSDNELMEQV